MVRPRFLDERSRLAGAERNALVCLRPIEIDASLLASRYGLPSMSPRLPHLRVLALCSAIALLALAARATTIRGPADLATLTAAADAVVLAKVWSSEAHWGTGGAQSGQLFTTVELVPREQWVGESVGDRLVVRTPGGELGELAQEVVGTPRLHPGDEVVLFLRLRVSAREGRPAIYEVSHWALGAFTVLAPAPGADKRAIRNRSGVECVGCRADESDNISLAELRANVVAAAANKARR